MIYKNRFLSVEAVAGPPDRFNIAGFGRIFFDLFADAVDVDRDRRRFPQASLPQTRSKRVSLLKTMPGSSEEQEEFKFLIGQAHFLPLHEDAMAALIDFKAVKTEGMTMDFPGRQLFIAGQVGLDAGHEFVRTERLYDVVVGTEAKAPYLIDIFLPGRYQMMVYPSIRGSCGRFGTRPGRAA